jgi:hypothetical protein
MSAAAILSVAARKAASEGKKVGAAALTLIALVVMSITVFPGLNRATTNQMAEAPLNPGSNQEASDTTGSSQQDSASDFGSPDAAAQDSGSAVTPSQATNPEANASTSSSSSAKVKKEAIEKALEGPGLADIMNADSRSKIFVLDQTYTAVGENGLTARFTFNPTSEAIFSGVFVQVELEDLIFDFRPVNSVIFSGKNAAGLDAFIFEGQVPTLTDVSGKKWSETVAKGAIFVIEVTMERNGTSVKSITLAMVSSGSN